MKGLGLMLDNCQTDKAHSQMEWGTGGESSCTELVIGHAPFQVPERGQLAMVGSVVEASQANGEHHWCLGRTLLPGGSSTAATAVRKREAGTAPRWCVESSSQPHRPSLCVGSNRNGYTWVGAGRADLATCGAVLPMLVAAGCPEKVVRDMGKRKRIGARRARARYIARMNGFGDSARAAPTECEWLLSKAMRETKPRIWFSSQHIFSPYIADFYIPSARLVVEVDDLGHRKKVSRKYDARRTTVLELRGLTVIRFWNSEVRADTRDVVARIREVMAGKVFERRAHVRRQRVVERKRKARPRGSRRLPASAPSMAKWVNEPEPQPRPEGNHVEF